jgi:hypothetical protein
MYDERSGKALRNNSAVGGEGEKGKGEGLGRSALTHTGGYFGRLLEKWQWHEVSPARSGTL